MCSAVLPVNGAPHAAWSARPVKSYEAYTYSRSAKCITQALRSEMIRANCRSHICFGLWLRDSSGSALLQLLRLVGSGLGSSLALVGATLALLARLGLSRRLSLAQARLLLLVLLTRSSLIPAAMCLLQ